MGALAVGAVVLVKFPFSDFSERKRRPAVALARVEHDDWILCQITSNPYADSKAIAIGDEDFISGALMRMSYVRPGKLFTINTSVIERVVAMLSPEKFAIILETVIDVLGESQ